MASDSVSSLILFIAAMLVAAGVAGTLVTNVTEISGSIDTYGGEVKEKIDTDVEIISDPGSDAIYNDTSENVSVLIKNTGQKTLASDGSALDVLIDGEYVSSESATFTVHEGSSDTWRRGEVAELELEQKLEPETEHRIVVIVNGDEETLRFYVP
ncbi:flagellar protein G [Haloterrigena sp. SYSU A558-1]|uniref:Flagellar protein G n=1 Tax=Haloterrigena gelatinilytica TaxID=2741724 RepID=A0A8J8GL40_9EURY|nr:flagellar protein G [Haloterrigena gelatinilytica]NUB89720.1 flagellar protein G [Haloterrigena gelatinilytica]NUC74449.1 flagellar protein G [Haloterrigena gelatinilytica]